MVDWTVRPTKHAKCMDKLLKYLMFFFMAVVLASCGGDDKDEPEDPNNVLGTTTFNLQANYPGNKDNRGQSLFHKSAWDHVSISFWGNGPKLVVDGGESNNPHIKYIGIVSALSEINISNAGAITQKEVEAIDKGGYIIEYITDGTAYYFKLLVRLNKNAAGEVIGASVQCQKA